MNTNEDTPDANPGDGTCADGSGNCSLRAAVMEANQSCARFSSSTPVCNIELPAGTYALSRVAQQGDEGAASGSLNIEAKLRVVGAGQAETVIDGSGDTVRESVFAVEVGSGASFSDMTIRNGNPSGIESSGDLALSDVALRENSGYGLRHSVGALTVRRALVEANAGGGIEAVPADTNDAVIEDSLVRDNRGGWGAGLHFSGRATVRDTTVIGNVGDEDDFTRGGGLYNRGDLRLIGSTVADNTARLAGGGIYNNGRMLVLNSTISGNHAAGSLAIPIQGGGIYNEQLLSVAFSTIFANEARNDSFGGAEGGGLYTTTNETSLKAIILSGNMASQWGQCVTEGGVEIESFGYNLIASADDCVIQFQGSDIVQTIQLEPLANNGGSTQTHVPAEEIPELSVISVQDCATADGETVAIDQRGTSRPQGAACTIGAVELN